MTCKPRGKIYSINEVRNWPRFKIRNVTKKYDRATRSTGRTLWRNMWNPKRWEATPTAAGCSSSTRMDAKLILKNKFYFHWTRYIGSMVADVHRTLKYGGIFMYPATGLTLIHNRFCFAEFLLQEFLPCIWVNIHPTQPTQHRTRTASSVSCTSACRWPTSSSRLGDSLALERKLEVLMWKQFAEDDDIETCIYCLSCRKPILDIAPKKLHERSPIFLGSREDVNDVLELIKKNREAWKEPLSCENLNLS